MVLPWVSDRRSPAFRRGLLGCPYYEPETDSIIFGVDRRYTRNLKQSVYFNLQKPFPYHSPRTNLNYEANQILNFRKDNPDTFIPSQLFRNCMNEFDIEPGKRNFFSELAFKKNPYYTDQYIAVYSDRKKNNLKIDFLSEIEINSGPRGLNVFDKIEIELPFTIKQIKSYSGHAFAVSSSQTVRLYSYLKSKFTATVEYIAPEEDYISGLDVSRYNSEISLILNESRNLVICNDISSSKFQLSANFSNCSYSLHPSLLFLSGGSDRIEIKDLRGIFPGLMISDLNVPFISIYSLITHKTDPNLIVISCQANIFNPISNSDTLRAEVRIYDIRFPKEATMRIATDSPIIHFISYETYANSEYDCLFGLDFDHSPWYWEFRHSKSNVQFSDGVLSLTENSKLNKESGIQFCADRKHIGYSIEPSFSHDGTLFLARLADDGELDYCTISDQQAIGPPCQSFITNENQKEILDFSFLEETIDSCLINTCSRRPENPTLNFGPMLQSTYYLDFYWNELKELLEKAT